MASLPALPFVRRTVTEGLSANESYRQFVATAHAEGLTGIRRQDYLRLYSETVAARATTPQAIDAPRTDLPSREIITRREVSRKWGGGYGSWVTVYHRPVGGGPVEPMPWLIRSSELLTPEEAEARAGAAVANNPYDYERTIVGFGYTGTDEYVPSF